MIGKIVGLLLTALLAAGGAGSAHAFTWFWAKKPVKEALAAQTILQIQAIESPGEYGPVARFDSSRNVFVICSDCPLLSHPVRDIQDINVSLRMSHSGQAMPETGSPEPTEPDPAPAREEYRLQDLSPDQSNLTAVPVQPTSPETQIRKMSSCLERPVYFGFNSTEISREERDRLKEISSGLRNSREIEVFGYTCEIGSKEYNDELALRRAKAVAQVLEGMGVSDIRVKAEGKCCYVSDDKAKNRRVEITCIKEQKKGG